MRKREGWNAPEVVSNWGMEWREGGRGSWSGFALPAGLKVRVHARQQIEWAATAVSSADWE